MKPSVLVVCLSSLTVSTLLLVSGCASSPTEPASSSPDTNVEATGADQPALAGAETDPNTGDASGARLAGGGAEQPPRPEGGECSGMMGLQCKDGLFCKFAMEAQCGAADQTGICAVPPEACTKDFNPVCGCDDKTYANECIAHSAGTSAAKKGECGE